MERWLPELVTTGGLKGLGVDLGEFADRLLDGKANAVFCCEVGEQFCGNARSTLMKTLNLALEFEIADDLSGNAADGLEISGFGGTPGHGSHRVTQIGREPRCSGGMARKWRGLDADAFVVYMFIVSVLPRGQG